MKKTILIVEDEKSLRDAVVDMLHIKSFLSLEAKNGREGVKLALKEHPDLILLDLIMPELDGMSALKEIREDAWGKKVPIIILTNLSATSEQIVSNVGTQELTQYVVKSDLKLHAIMEMVESMLAI